MEALRVGYRIPFDRRPPLSERPLSLLAYSRQPIKVVALTQELQTLLRKGAVEPAPQSPGFYNRLFLVQKASGSWHPIIDLSPWTTMSPRLFLHGDSTVSPSFHSPRRLDGLSGSAGRLPAGSYSSRFASLSSLRGRRKDVPVQGPLLRSHNRAPSLHEDYGSHFRHPPQVWTIDSSWPIQNSSLVYLGMEIRSLPFMARPPPIRVSNLLRLLEEFLSTPSPPASLWCRLLGHLSSLTFSFLTGCSEWGCSSLASRTSGISWTTSFRSPDPLSVESIFSGGLEWPSCVKEYLSLFQSQTSATYQTLRMWVGGPS